jgi:hypothetical protein
LQPLGHRLLDELVEAIFVAEADLGLGRVDVGIHLLGRHLQEEEGHRVASGHEQSPVGILHRLE